MPPKAQIKTPHLVYNEYSDTIRQMPQNYCIAVCHSGRWVCDPDKASNKDLATAVFTVLFEDYNATYGSPEYIIEKVNAYIKKNITL